nr:MAG TPA: hypothetical protein [Caudoviricetes sp.]
MHSFHRTQRFKGGSTPPVSSYKKYKQFTEVK